MAIGLLLVVSGVLTLRIAFEFAGETVAMVTAGDGQYHPAGTSGYYWNYSWSLTRQLISAIFPFGMPALTGIVLLNDSFRRRQYCFSAPSLFAASIIVLALWTLIWPGPRQFTMLLFIVTASLSAVLCTLTERLFGMTVFVMGIGSALYLGVTIPQGPYGWFMVTWAALILSGLGLNLLRVRKERERHATPAANHDFGPHVRVGTRRLRGALLLFIIVSSLTGYLRFAERYQRGYGVPRHPHLPDTASVINYREQLNRNRVFVADFDIPEQDFKRYLVSVGCPPSEAGTVVMNTASEGRFTGTLLYSGKSPSHLSVVAAYDRSSGRANIEMSFPK